MSSTTLDSAPNASSENLSEVWRKFTDYMESEIRLEVHPDAIAVAQFAHKVARLSTATSVAMLEMRPTSRGPFFGTKNSKARRAKPPSLKWLLGDFEKALVEGEQRDDFIDWLREQANHQPTRLRECLKQFRKAIKSKDLEGACRASREIRGEIVSSELLGRIEQIKPLFQEAIQQLEDAGNQFKTRERTTIEARYCSNIAERLKSLKEVYSKHFEPLGQEHVPTDLMPKEPVKISPAVPVEIEEFTGKSARCLAEYEGRWLPISLDQASLEAADLRPKDTFQWIPRADGIVREKDIVIHPRRFSKEDEEHLRQDVEQFRQYIQTRPSRKSVRR